MIRWRPRRRRTRGLAHGEARALLFSGNGSATATVRLLITGAAPVCQYIRPESSANGAAREAKSRARATWIAVMNAIWNGYGLACALVRRTLRRRARWSERRRR